MLASIRRPKSQDFKLFPFDIGELNWTKFSALIRRNFLGSRKNLFYFFASWCLDQSTRQFFLSKHDPKRSFICSEIVKTEPMKLYELFWEMKANFCRFYSNEIAMLKKFSSCFLVTIEEYFNQIRAILLTLFTVGCRARNSFIRIMNMSCCSIKITSDPTNSLLKLTKT